MKWLIIVSVLVFSQYGLSTACLSSEIVRPTIIPIMDARINEKTGETLILEMQRVLHSAIKRLTNREKAVLPSDIETIVMMQKKEGWLVAFVVKGNGRLAKERAGQIFLSDVLLSPGVVLVDVKSMEASDASELYTVLPWPTKMLSNFLTSYADQTSAEKMYNVSVEGDLVK
jgi:hypothetical protein